MDQKKRNLIVSVGLCTIALAAVSWVGMGGMTPTESREASIGLPELEGPPATSGDEVPATPERLCEDEEITADSTELFSAYEGAPLHALYTTDRYRVALVVLPGECTGPSEHWCFVCVAATIGGTVDGDINDLCRHFGTFIRSNRTLPDGDRESAVDEYVTLELAGMVNEMTGSSICNLRYEFDVAQLFSEEPPPVFRVPPAPPGSITI